MSISFLCGEDESYGTINTGNWDASRVEDDDAASISDTQGDDGELDISIALNKRSNRRAFLITYSRANMLLFPTRQTFAEAMLAALRENGTEEPLCWACGLEEHKDGAQHYHLAVKFQKERKWLSAWNYMRANYHVTVNFAEKSKMYIAAYRYVTKSDPNPLLSDGHKPLDAIAQPRTAKCVSASSRAAASRRRSREDASDEGSGPAVSKKIRASRLTNGEVSEFIYANDIKTVVGLEAFAKKRFDEGEKVCKIGLL